MAPESLKLRYLEFLRENEVAPYEVAVDRGIFERTEHRRLTASGAEGVEKSAPTVRRE